jgi:hypothetical protein
MRLRPAVLALTAALVLAACGSSADSRGATAPQKGLKPDVVPASHGAAGGVPDTAAAAPLARAVTRTATVAVRVDDVPAAARAATAAAERVGGYVEGEESRLDAATLTLRVPPARFTSVGDEVARLGTVEQRQVQTDDVTGEVADVAGRLAAARASTGRLRGLLDRAGSISEVTTIESSVSEREAEIESLDARRRALADETALATLTVTLSRAAAPAAPIRRAAEIHGFTGGLRVGWTAFTRIVAVLLVLLGALLPFLAVAAAFAVPMALYVRRKRAAHAA